MWRLLGRLDRRSLRSDSIFVAGFSVGRGKVFVVWSVAESWASGTERNGKGRMLCEGSRAFRAENANMRKSLLAQGTAAQVWGSFCRRSNSESLFDVSQLTDSDYLFLHKPHGGGGPISSPIETEFRFS